MRGSRFQIATIGFAVALLLGLSTASATADITSLAARITADVLERVSGDPGERDTQDTAYPDGVDALPAQAIARVFSLDDTGAGVAAAQFADPQTATADDLSDNPEEFALSVTLSSIGELVDYDAIAEVVETRGVRLAALDLGVSPGQNVNLIGRFYLDATLVVFAIDPAVDLSAVTASVDITVVQRFSNETTRTVFEGNVLLEGAAAGTTSLSTDGSITTDNIEEIDLSDVDPELGVFRAYVVPALIFEYPYEAIADQEFEFITTVQVEATNTGNNVGVAAVLGAPLDAFQDAITGSSGANTAKRMTRALQDARTRSAENIRTTDPLETLIQTQPLVPLCGLFGVEMLLGVVGVAGLRLARFGRRL
jgi:hypothetical protein